MLKRPSLIDRLAAALAPGRVGAGEAAWRGGPGACVVRIDADGRIEQVSPGATALLSRPLSELQGVALAGLFHEDDRAAIAAALAGTGADRVLAVRLAGETRHFDLAVETAAGAPGTVLLADRTRERVQRDELEAALRLARRDAEAARAKSRGAADFLADLSHEMRTPLNAVIGYAEAMRAETFGPLGHPKYAEYAGVIRASGGHLLDLVSGILDLARIEADRFALKRERVSPAALAHECASMMRRAAEDAGLKLVTEIADDLPDCLLDPRAVRQILLNLLSNAVKFTSDGEIRLSLAREGEAIVVTVADTGVGMNESELAALGARFTSAQGEGVRGAKGAGLGLSLAFALAELHGGSMRLASAPGEGVTARVALPISRPVRPRRRAAAPSAKPAAKPARKKTPRLSPREIAEAARPFAAVEDIAEARRADAPPPAILTQLERIEAYRRERQRTAA
jgi:cell cycle sensor histidine kinase DivJ